jgi:hypothetical protein
MHFVGLAAALLALVAAGGAAGAGGDWALQSMHHVPARTPRPRPPLLAGILPSIRFRSRTSPAYRPLRLIRAPDTALPWRLREPHTNTHALAVCWPSPLRAPPHVDARTHALSHRHARTCAKPPPICPPPSPLSIPPLDMSRRIPALPARPRSA